MNLFDSIKDAFTTDDSERLDAAEKTLAELQKKLEKAKADNNIPEIATLEQQINAANEQITDLKAKVAAAAGAAPAAEAPATEAPAEAPVGIEEPAPAAPAPAAEPVAQQEAPAAPQAVSEPEYREYTVVPGDTLSKIGREFGVNYMDIVKLNGIPNPDEIFPGQVFKIPNA